MAGGILWSQQQQLAAAVTALGNWQAAALEAGVSVTQINVTLLGEHPRQVIFEWDDQAGEYAMRTSGD